MKLNKYLLAGVATFMALGVTACGGDGPTDDTETFSFTAQLIDPDTREAVTTVYVGERAKIEILSSMDFEDKEFTYRSSDTSIATVSTAGFVTGVSEGTVSFYITEVPANPNDIAARYTLSNITISTKARHAEGGFNFASASGAQAIQKRTEILGKLEKYAMDNHLTGITLFENGGYVKYRPEVTLPTTNYVTGYGFGILTEGSIDADLANESNPAYKRYYHTAQSQDPLTINAWNATGSQVSDLSSYITSSYWGTKLNATKTEAEWYPVLAKDTIKDAEGHEVAQSRPTHVDADNALGLYNTWRIYLKTGAANEGGIQYRYTGSNGSYDHQALALEDYEFAFKILLTGSNKMKRGAEMAGDTAYGIKGAQKFYNDTKNTTSVEQIDTLWNNMKASGELGIKTGTDPVNGSYIELSLINPIDDFTAMYTLSSNLYSPIPRNFFLALTDSNTYAASAKAYGSFNSSDDILSYVISVGPYYLERWNKRQLTVFSRDDNWFEYRDDENKTRYKIAGVHIRLIDTSSDEEAIYKEFNKGSLHSCGIPTGKLNTEIGQDNVYQTKGDSTFKLNVNSCTQEYWDELFGANGTINKGSNWEVKPWMSNDAFLKGLFHSINRIEFARKRGVQPSINYFSDAYLSDPENLVSYNSTQEHKDAVAAYQTTMRDENGQMVDAYGYSLDKAVQYFKTAVNQLVKAGKIERGTQANPTIIKIHIRWMYQTDTREYGEDIANYFTTAFNNPLVSDNRVKLVVEQDAVTSWEDVYNVWMMKGQFDLAFGAISGNTYNPLNFLEVLKSDNSSGFTLNWGNDTSKVDDKNQLVYDGKAWSFDALWECSDHGGVVENGAKVKTVKACYMDTPTKLDGTGTTADLTKGAKITIPMEFVNVPDVAFSADPADGGKVQLFIVGYGNRDLPFTLSADKKSLIVTISEEVATEINNQIRETNKFREEDGYKDWADKLNCFNLDTYGQYWTLEVYYSLSISGGTPTQNYITVEKNKDSHEFNK